MMHFDMTETHPIAGKFCRDNILCFEVKQEITYFCWLKFLHFRNRRYFKFKGAYFIYSARTYRSIVSDKFVASEISLFISMII